LLIMTVSSKLFSLILSISSSFYFIYKHKKQHDHSLYPEINRAILSFILSLL